MKNEMKDKMIMPVKGLKLPRYHEIPDVGLYLEQTAKFINGYLAPLGGMEITTSMISNYVKQGIIASPVKKQYCAEQIAYLFFVAVAKNVLSMDNLRMLIDIQRKSYEVCTAYDYFCREFEKILGSVFGVCEAEEGMDAEATDEKILLRNTIIAVSHKIYLDKYIEALKEIDEESRT